MRKLQDINIFLTGMMGSGKTSVGLILSKILKFDLVDIDNEIEVVTNLPISQIFKSYGEKKFRQMERFYFIEKYKTSKRCVFSTSGGIVLDKDCRNLLKNESFTFLLKSHPTVLHERLLKSSPRPLLLDVEDQYEAISKIWDNRKELYSDSAKFTIKVDNISSLQAAQSIQSIIYENS